MTDSTPKPEQDPKPEESKKPLSFEELLESGSGLLKKGRVDDALKRLEKAVRMKPKNVQANREIIQCYHLARKRHPRRSSEFRFKLKQAYKNLEDQCHGLFMTFCAIGEFQKALPLFEELRKIVPDYRSKYDEEIFKYYQEQGESCLNEHRYKQAKENFEKASELGYCLGTGQNKRLAPIYWGLATSCEKIKKSGLAIKHFEKAIELDGQMSADCGQRLAQIYRKQAFIFERKNDHEKSVTALEKALQFDKKNVKLLDQLGRAYFKLEKFDRALACFQKADEIQPDDLRTLINLAKTLRALGEKEKADSLSQKIQDLKKKGLVPAREESPPAAEEPRKAQTEKPAGPSDEPPPQTTPEQAPPAGEESPPSET